MAGMGVASAALSGQGLSVWDVFPSHFAFRTLNPFTITRLIETCLFVNHGVNVTERRSLRHGPSRAVAKRRAAAPLTRRARGPSFEGSCTQQGRRRMQAGSAKDAITDEQFALLEKRFGAGRGSADPGYDTGTIRTVAAGMFALGLAAYAFLYSEIGSVRRTHPCRSSRVQIRILGPGRRTQPPRIRDHRSSQDLQSSNCGTFVVSTCDQKCVESPRWRISAQTGGEHRLPCAREPYVWRAAGLFRRQRCGPVRAIDIPFATEPLSVAAIGEQRSRATIAKTAKRLHAPINPIPLPMSYSAYRSNTRPRVSHQFTVRELRSDSMSGGTQ